MKIVKNITHKGITYIDEFGTEGFVDFKKCNEGWIQYKKRTCELNNNTSVDIDTNNRCVGQRDICADPCFIEFFAHPKFTRFEFEKTSECLSPEKSFTRFKDDIIAAGWNTLDLS